MTMAKQHKKFDCTQEDGNRGDAFTMLQGFTGSLLMNRKQFTVERTTNPDGSFSLVIEGNGRSLGDPEPPKSEKPQPPTKPKAPTQAA